MSDHIHSMLEAHPSAGESITPALQECIRACFACAETCAACADACLAEATATEMTRCIRINLDCADICTTTGRVLLRRTAPVDEVVRAQLQACAAVSKHCASECETHEARLEHCRLCAQSCRRCEEACHALIHELVPDQLERPEHYAG